MAELASNLSSNIWFQWLPDGFVSSAVASLGTGVGGGSHFVCSGVERSLAESPPQCGSWGNASLCGVFVGVACVRVEQPLVSARYGLGGDRDRPLLRRTADPWRLRRDSLMLRRSTQGISDICGCLCWRSPSITSLKGWQWGWGWRRIKILVLPLGWGCKICPRG